MEGLRYCVRNGTQGGYEVVVCEPDSEDGMVGTETLLARFPTRDEVFFYLRGLMKGGAIVDSFDSWIFPMSLEEKSAFAAGFSDARCNHFTFEEIVRTDRLVRTLGITDYWDSFTKVLEEIRVADPYPWTL